MRDWSYWKYNATEKIELLKTFVDIIDKDINFDCFL